MHGFESFVSLDIVRGLVDTFAQGEKKTDALKWLSIFPSQHSAITTYQEAQPDKIHGEFRLPSEQMTFIYTMVKAAMEMHATNAPAQ